MSAPKLLTQAVNLLRQTEWHSDGGAGLWCNYCKGGAHPGSKRFPGPEPKHAPDCPLAALFAADELLRLASPNARRKRLLVGPVVWTMCAKDYHALCDDDQAKARGSVRRCGCACHKAVEEKRRQDATKTTDH